MSEAEARKVATHHLEREACLYVRQSSLRQVMQHTESTRRQYGLRHKATALGWAAERIRVIDEDQGKSGAYSGNRSGFRDLMGSIAAGDVGIVLGLEVSRLARDNADWHQLLRIAGITNTLILDETGIYDPNDGNDKLLLGVKGTLSEFELQGIRARMLSQPGFGTSLEQGACRSEQGAGRGGRFCQCRFGGGKSCGKGCGCGRRRVGVEHGMGSWSGVDKGALPAAGARDSRRSTGLPRSSDPASCRGEAGWRGVASACVQAALGTGADGLEGVEREGRAGEMRKGEGVEALVR